MLCKKLPRNWRMRIRCYQEENTGKQWKLEEFRTQHDQELRTVSLFFYDPDLLSSYDGPTFLIKLLLPRVQESRAAKLECREVHGIIWVFLETFFIVSEILMTYTIIQEIWNTIGNCWWCRGFWEERELRIMGPKYHCNQHLYLAFL